MTNITKSNLNAYELNITDIAVLDEYLFILDLHNGIYVYDVINQKVVTKYDLNIEAFNITKAYGLSVLYNNGYYQFDVVNSTFVN